jgi:hypothetical protein
MQGNGRPRVARRATSKIARRFGKTVNVTVAGLPQFDSQGPNPEARSSAAPPSVSGEHKVLPQADWGLSDREPHGRGADSGSKYIDLAGVRNRRNLTELAPKTHLCTPGGTMKQNRYESAIGGSQQTRRMNDILAKRVTKLRERGPQNSVDRDS